MVLPSLSSRLNEERQTVNRQESPGEKNKAGVALICGDFIQHARKIEAVLPWGETAFVRTPLSQNALRFSGLNYWSQTLSMTGVIWEPGNDCLLCMAVCLGEAGNILQEDSVLRADAGLKQKQEQKLFKNSYYL